MDAIAPVRDLLYDSHVHDFQMQPQGPDNKHVVPAFFVQSNGLIETQASLYRPITKKGDPRIWFYDLKKHCHPCNLLALTVIDEAIYVSIFQTPLLLTRFCIRTTRIAFCNPEIRAVLSSNICLN